MQEIIGSPSIQFNAEGTTVTHTYEQVGATAEAVFTSQVPPYQTPHPTLPGLFLDSAEVTSKTEENATRMVLVFKTLNKALTNGGEVWEWDSQAQLEHITSVNSPLDQIHYPAQFNCGSVIGFDGEDVKGVDVYRPAGSFKVIRELETITAEERAFLFEAQGSVNAYDWHGYYAGEVLYLGASIRQNSKDRIEVTLQFQSKSFAPATMVHLLSGEAVPVTPAPWDYVWFQHGEQLVDDGENGMIRQRGIRAIHIARVYPLLDFGWFNLSGPYG